jgi:3-hydroxyacyl-CoA dehydrogenase
VNHEGSERVRRVAVVGTGVIGASWTAIFLACGLDVFASSPDSESSLRDFVHRAWPNLSTLASSFPGASPERLTFFSDLETCVRDVDWVQESVPEREALKQSLFTQLDRLLPKNVILASSSSGLSMTAIQQGCVHPDRCVIGHPINPAHLIPLVEVVGGEKTSEETIQRAMRFYTQLYKKPIRLREEIKGHAANRLQAALWSESIHLVTRGVLTVRDLDSVVSWGLGLRWGVMGPNLLFHLGGGPGGIRKFLDHLGESLAVWVTDLGSLELSPMILDAIEKGVLEEAGNDTIAALEQERDRVLVGLLALRMHQAGAQEQSQNGGLQPVAGGTT